MSVKQNVLEVVASLPDDASWSDVTEALYRLAAIRGTAKDATGMLKVHCTEEELVEFLNSDFPHSMDDVIAELEAEFPERESA